VKNEISNIISRVKASKSLDEVDGVIGSVVQCVDRGNLTLDRDSLSQLHHATFCHFPSIVRIGTDGNNPVLVRRQADILGKVHQLGFNLNGSVGKQPTVPK